VSLISPTGALPKGLINALVILTVFVEAIRALMIQQINRLNAVPHISQIPGALGITRKVCDLHRRFFPNSRKASLLRTLRRAQLVVFVFGIFVFLAGQIEASRHQ
jgi:hypothetical protein